MIDALKVSVIILAMIITFFIVGFCSPGHAKEQYPGQYANVDAKKQQWYKSLKSKNGVGCCAEADCHSAEMAYKDGDYYAILPDGLTLKIPPGVILDEEYERTNPTGSAVVCYTATASEYDVEAKPEYSVLCFVRGNWT